MFSLQDQDFCLLKRGDPMFLMFSGETVRYEEEKPLHPFFINEAAYYEKGFAFHLAQKKTITIPSIQAKKDWKELMEHGGLMQTEHQNAKADTGTPANLLSVCFC